MRVVITPAIEPEIEELSVDYSFDFPPLSFPPLSFSFCALLKFSYYNSSFLSTTFCILSGL